MKKKAGWTVTVDDVTKYIHHANPDTKDEFWVYDTVPDYGLYIFPDGGRYRWEIYDYELDKHTPFVGTEGTFEEAIETLVDTYNSELSSGERVARKAMKKRAENHKFTWNGIEFSGYRSPDIEMYTGVDSDGANWQVKKGWFGWDVEVSYPNGTKKSKHFDSFYNIGKAEDALDHFYGQVYNREMPRVSKKVASGMPYQIWQIDYDWEEKHDGRRSWRFDRWDWAMDDGFNVDDYVKMYEGEIAYNGNVEQTLERIFEVNNRDDRPNGSYMYSVSLSDIIVLPELGSAWYVDRMGFVNVTEYFGGKIARKRASVDWGAYDAEALTRADDLYLPDRGEGETMATQIVTAVAKLVHEWYNNGGVYDKCETCNNVSSYANWLYEYAAKYNSAIADALVDGSRAIGDKWFGDIDESAYEDALYALALATESDAAWLEKMNEIPAQGTVYRCDGPFEYIDFEDEEDDDWRW